ncbi:hypothetical protein H0H92_001767 [Tricholoma furcatifolium]|nr:hypothetical protein H0H92_001767 [Tricholoma furcatifolium]
MLEIFKLDDMAGGPVLSGLSETDGGDSTIRETRRDKMRKVSPALTAEGSKFVRTENVLAALVWFGNRES